ncbi:MAG TPA: site-2 protease family protein [Chitinophagaceae bacterium]|nr:site-2 protease family protein [Chitinophagaceae bacterium]
MENNNDSLMGMNQEEQPVSLNEVIVYPPKFEKSDQASAIWLRSIISLAAYLILGYYIFPNYFILLLITAIIMIHEMGHFLAMRYFRYNDLGIFFIPLLGAYVSGSKREVSQLQSAVILLAGPLPGIIIGIVLYLSGQNHELYYFGVSLSRIGLLFIILNVINLFPVYPLDGGQLLNRVFLDEEGIWSKVFVFLSAAFMSWLAIKIPFYLLLIFPAMMLFRFFGEQKFGPIEKKIEAEGINTDIDYADLPDEDYWKIRNILIEENPSFRDVPPSPPFEYSHKEDKIMSMVQSLLHRHLIQDVSIAGKILIFLLWAAAIATPWLIDMDMSFFKRIGF